jgi:hypothetical protein
MRSRRGDHDPAGRGSRMQQDRSSSAGCNTLTVPVQHNRTPLYSCRSVCWHKSAEEKELSGDVTVWHWNCSWVMGAFPHEGRSVCDGNGDCLSSSSCSFSGLSHLTFDLLSIRALFHLTYPKSVQYLPQAMKHPGKYKGRDAYRTGFVRATYGSSTKANHPQGWGAKLWVPLGSPGCRKDRQAVDKLRCFRAGGDLWEAEPLLTCSQFSLLFLPF